MVARNDRPVSIYKLANQTEKAYNRVHANVNQLESLGLVSTENTIVNGRQTRHVMLAKNA